ncbi:MAG: ACT domain-containing protein [Oscillospiraceae bacterium]
MRAFVTVIGKDRVGIMAAVCTLLAEKQVNILDISQTILQDCFTMIMLTDASACTVPFNVLAENLAETGRALEVTIHLQREEIFKSASLPD